VMRVKSRSDPVISLPSGPRYCMRSLATYTGGLGVDVIVEILG
jgi:hypothetical protein